MRMVGYARVSTNVQDTQLQLDALRAVGVVEIYAEKTSSVGRRPELQRLLASLQSGDLLIVWKLDRIARSLHDLLSILARLKAASIGLRSLTEPIDTSSPIGEFMVQVLGAVAQLEKAMIRERCIAGQVAAIKRGVQFGRPKLMTDADELEAFARWLLGESKSELARAYGVNLIVIRRAIDDQIGHKKTGGCPVLSAYL